MSGGLFDTVPLKKIELKNRFEFATAPNGGATDPAGGITGDEVQHLAAFAEFGVGLIITGAVGISAYAISKGLSLACFMDETTGC